MTSKDIWYPIESAPKDGTPILAYDPTRSYTSRCPILCRWMPGLQYRRRLDRNGFIGMKINATYWKPPGPPDTGKIAKKCSVSPINND